MSVFEVDIEKPKKQPTRRFRRGCMVALAVLVGMCVLCYGSIWLFARTGAAWVSSQIITPVPGSTPVAEGTFQEYSVITDWQLYTLPGSLEEVQAQLERPIQSDSINLCYDNCQNDSGLYWLYGLSFALTQSGRTYFDGSIRSRCHFSEIYRSKAAFLESMQPYFPVENYVIPDSLPPDAVIQLTQTCYYAFD